MTDMFRYQMVIVWSDEDNCYLVHLSDFPEQTHRTHGDSYEEAAKNGNEVLQLLLEEDGLTLPTPKLAAAQLATCVEQSYAAKNPVKVNE